ncbi:C2 family cysteine protease [Streptomyces sp. NPDC051322]|uniref:C2 family cysteine protease n=1 Tax=Streptomyces sp. NPDC051322 TaxID=3154645 RepID=UPI00344EF3DB
MTFRGFDSAQIRAMAGHMKKIGPGARKLHGDVASVLREAQGLLDGKPATTSPRLEPLIGQILPMFYSGLPASLHPELDDTSASLTRRCAQIDGIQQLELKGYPVDPSLYFDDEAVPDQKKIDDALSYFDDHIDDSGGFLWSDSAQGAQEVLDKFHALSPAELDAVMSRMTPQQLQELNSQLGEGSSWWGAGGADDTVKAQWVNMLTKGLGPATLAKITPALSNLRFEPDADTQYTDGLKYRPVDGTLFGPNGVDIKHDLQQGQDGDCWFLSSLAAISERDPDFFQQHITQNPNGTYTVTFYQQGPLPGMPAQPVEITVDNKLPVGSDGKPAYANAPDQVMWVAIYEKAYAQYRGGYGKIDGGWGDVGLRDLTGQPTERTDTGDLSLADINEKIKDGQAVTSGTRGDGDVHDDRIVSGHEYSVERVDMNADPPTITLLNPWGGSGVENGKVMPQEITLTQDEYRKNFDEIGLTKTGV